MLCSCSYYCYKMWKNVKWLGEKFSIVDFKGLWGITGRSTLIYTCTIHAHHILHKVHSVRVTTTREFAWKVECICLEVYVVSRLKTQDVFESKCACIFNSEPTYLRLHIQLENLPTCFSLMNVNSTLCVYVLFDLTITNSNDTVER